MMKKFLGVFGLSLVLFVGYQALPFANNFALAHNHDHEKVKTFNEKNSEIKIEEGHEFVINLVSNASTGFKWIESDKPDAEFLVLMSSDYKNAKPKPGKDTVPMPGAPGHEEWKFKALKKGKTEIKLKYVRPWEDKATPAKEAVFKIEII